MNPVSEQEGRKRPGQSASAGRFTRRGRGVRGGKARAEQQQVGGEGPAGEGQGPGHWLCSSLHHRSAASPTTGRQCPHP